MSFCFFPSYGVFYLMNFWQEKMCPVCFFQPHRDRLPIGGLCVSRTPCSRVGMGRGGVAPESQPGRSVLPRPSPCSPSPPDVAGRGRTLQESPEWPLTPCSESGGQHMQEGGHVPLPAEPGAPGVRADPCPRIPCSGPAPRHCRSDIWRSFSVA